MLAHLLFHFVHLSPAREKKSDRWRGLHPFEAFWHMSRVTVVRRPCVGFVPLQLLACDHSERRRWSFGYDCPQGTPPPSAAPERTPPETPWLFRRCHDAGRADGPTSTDLRPKTHTSETTTTRKSFSGWLLPSSVQGEKQFEKCKKKSTGDVLIGIIPVTVIH